MRRLPALLLPIGLLGLVAACADLSSMPTAPEATASSDWTELYAPLVLDELNAVWGMDADDVWMVGRHGTVLHHDGERMVRHEIETTRELEDVDGNTPDDVWAVGDDMLLRWDGRRWSEHEFDESIDLECVFCEGPDRVWLGGRHRSPGEPTMALVRRWTGSGWKDWKLPSEISRVEKIWRPHEHAPLVAIVRDSVYHTYAIDDGRWQLLAWPGECLDADGDLVLIEPGDSQQPVALCRIEPDLSLSVVCESFPGDRILQSRGPVVSSISGLYLEAQCTRRRVLEDPPRSIRDIAVPERPGPRSALIFAVGNDGLVMKGCWLPDWSMDWQVLSPHDSYELTSVLVVAQGQAFLPFYHFSQRGVFVHDGGTWHLEPLEFTPDRLTPLASGDLIAWNRWWNPGIHRRTPDGRWHALPPLDGDVAGVWGSSPDTLLVMSEESQLFRLDGDAWRLIAELGGRCDWFDGTAADHLFALISLDYPRDQHLLAFDGTAWRDIKPDDAILISTCYLGPHTGTLYAGFNTSPFGHEARTYRDGQWESFPTGDDYDFYPEYVQEAADGALYRCNGKRILRAFPGGWKSWYRLDAYVDAFFVSPTEGVVALADHRLHHHPYRPR